MTSILIVEDDAKTAQAIRAGLQNEGYDSIVASSGEEGLHLLDAQAFDAVVLDWMLPGRDGIEVVEALRARGNRMPVLLLTARDAIEDRVLGLDSGADDYLIKPFAFAELVARLRVLLRRAGERESAQIQVGDLTIDLERRRVQRGSRVIALSPREFDLLAYLARHQSQTVSRQMLARVVWHELRRATPLDNVIDVHIAHLRRKIDDGQPSKLLHTVRGVGFTLADDPSHA
jgi:two-component system, OmpR family, copper resistance phosphate regulon response regulator CusR